ncbi:MAG: heavy metal-associated domain-containing protein [Oscillospiraceae bacterium]
MKKIINIEGMNCGHCTLRVEDALMSLNGVESVKVSLEDKKAIAEINKPIDDDTVNDVIYGVGFDVISIEDVK